MPDEPEEVWPVVAALWEGCEVIFEAFGLTDIFVSYQVPVNVDEAT